MTAFNLLIDAVAGDEAYLQDTLARAAKQDDFTARLLSLMSSSAPARAAARAAAAAAAGSSGGSSAAGGGGEGAGQPEVVLGVHRSDYMLDAPSGGFLQVRWQGRTLKASALTLYLIYGDIRVLATNGVGGTHQQKGTVRPALC